MADWPPGGHTISREWVWDVNQRHLMQTAQVCWWRGQRLTAPGPLPPGRGDVQRRVPSAPGARGCSGR